MLGLFLKKNHLTEYNITFNKMLFHSHLFLPMKIILLTLVASLIVLPSLGQKNPFKPKGSSHYKDGVSLNWIPSGYVDYWFDDQSQEYIFEARHELKYDGYKLIEDRQYYENGDEWALFEYVHKMDGSFQRTGILIENGIHIPMERFRYFPGFLEGFDEFYIEYEFQPGPGWEIDYGDSIVSIQENGKFLGHEEYEIFNIGNLKTVYSEISFTATDTLWNWYEWNGGVYDLTDAYKVSYLNGKPYTFTVDEAGEIIRIKILNWLEEGSFTMGHSEMERSTDGGITFESISKIDQEGIRNDYGISKEYNWEMGQWVLMSKNETHYNSLSGEMLSGTNWYQGSFDYGDTTIQTFDGQGRVVEELYLGYYQNELSINGKRVYFDHVSDISSSNNFKIELFPNPAKERIQLSENARILGVINHLGQAFNVPKFDYRTLDVSSLKAGIYSVVINSGQHLRFIKE
ncbi:MAG: hypothetical protein ACI9YL_000584 [Luteibaculaceae bacterium]|jgi:hypothetical protein